ncbi:MAG: 30S ribosomal protein S6 [Planctomycetes bacterium]|nr:30S ribosomal protein S6 [Planctomycetota bacterium]
MKGRSAGSPAPDGGSRLSSGSSGSGSGGGGGPAGGAASAAATSVVGETATRLRPYEAMFLVFNKEAKKSHDYLEEHLKALLDKVGAKLVRFGKWEQRSLAYEIKGQRDGIFYLTYFEVDPKAITTLKREAELSEFVLRVLILALDRVPTEDDERRRAGSIEEALREGEEQRGEGGFDGGGGGGGGDRRRGRGPRGDAGPADSAGDAAQS